MIDRRLFTQGGLISVGLGLSGVFSSPLEATEINDDGLHTQPWFHESFLDLRDDLAEANEANKRLVVLWEQRGCPYCRELHRVNFSDERITNYIKSHFIVLQLNLFGSREVTDFDGKAMEEREVARKWGVNFTPTLMFLNDESKADKSARDLEIARMPGYFKPFHFISMLEYVQEKAYEKHGFQRFLQDKFARLKAEGKDPEVW